MQISNLEVLWGLMLGTVSILVLMFGLIGSLLSNQHRRLKLQQEQIEKISASEKKYRNLFENSLVGMIRLSLSDGMILEANDAFRQMVGVGATENLTSLVHHFPRHVYDHLRDALLKTGAVEGFQFSLSSSDHKLVWLLFSGRMMEDGAYAEGVVQDVTSRVVAQEKVVQAKKIEAVGILSGGIAHDLKGIFKPMQMTIESIRTKHEDPMLARRLGMVEEGIALGLNLVGKVLDFAKGASAAKGQVSVDKLLSRVESLLSETKSGTLKVFVRAEEGLEPIYADEAQAYQVVYNLSINAKDAMPSGGELRIVADSQYISEGGAQEGLTLHPGRYVRIRVSDTGTGIPPHELKKIGEPFYSTKGSSGTGLGLATTFNIVHNHQGDISVESEVGKGSTFSVYFPVLNGQLGKH